MIMTERAALQHKNEQIVKKMVKSLDEDPYDPKRYYDLGSMLTKIQSFQQAEELFLKGLNVFTKDPSKQGLLHYGLGNVYYATGLYEKAISEFSKVKDAKLKADALLMIAQGYYAQNQYQQAMVFALTASENATQDPAPKALLGDCFLATGDFQNAQKYYDKALALNKKDIHVNFQRGLTALVQGQKADIYFTRVKKRDPQYLKKHQERLNDIASLLKKQNGKGGRE